MRLKIVSSLCIAAGMAAVGVAHADSITNLVFKTAKNTSGGGVILTIDDQGTPNDGHGHSLPGYTAYELSFTPVNKANGWASQVLDFGNIYHDANTGFTGPLVYQSIVTTAKGVTTTTPILYDAATTDQPNAGTYYSALGSHFLDDQPANVAAGPDAFGTSGASVQSTPSDSGYVLNMTDEMVGATGYYNQNLPTTGTQPFAYLVIPNGQTVNYSGQDVLIQATAGRNPPLDVVNIDGSITGGSPVPEPASLALFGFGATLLLLRRRQRKNQQS
jgi:hypothetical protein